MTRTHDVRARWADLEQGQSLGLDEVAAERPPRVRGEVVRAARAPGGIASTSSGVIAG
jgi:hypothetical protein